MSDQTPLPEPRDWSLVVATVRDVTPSMRRITLTGDDLADLVYLPGQDMAIAVPAGGSDGGATVRRRYTIRALDRENGTVDLDFVLHGDGPAARWAAGASPGDCIEAIAPRGKITLDATASWHLFAGDDAAVPAVAAMFEALPPATQALAYLEVGEAKDEQVLASPAGTSSEVTWVHRDGTEPGTRALLVEQLRTAELPPGPGHAYIAGEFSLVQACRQLLAARGLDRERISPKPYWRLGRRNMPHGEPERD